jgi:hypothetical protein
MLKGWLSGFGRHRRWIVQAVMLSLVLPVLIGLLPQPALSAAAALERDLALSLCNPYGGDDPAESGHRPAAHDTCILCTACAAVTGPALANATPGLDVRPRLAHPMRRAVPAFLPPAAAFLLDGSPPRGPPALVPA